MAVETVGPAMIWAAESAARAAAFCDDRCAVPADIRERAEPAVLGSCDENGLAGDFGGQVSPGFGDRGRQSDRLPCAAEDVAMLAFEHRGGRVPNRGDG